MVPCKHCLTANSLDSTFCKHCGTSLPEAELTDAKEKLEALVQTGFDLLKDNRSEEAMVIAETAVVANPSSAAAASLKGMCHEARGEVAEALECYEKVVALKPDSALDKIKVNQLRNMMVAKVTVPPAPDRKGPLLVAAAVTMLVVVGGIGLVKAMQRPPAVASNDNKVPVSSGTGQALTSFEGSTGPVSTGPPGPIQSTPPSNGGSQLPDNGNGGTGPIVPPNGGRTGLPPVGSSDNGGGGADDTGHNPVVVVPPVIESNHRPTVGGGDVVVIDNPPTSPPVGPPGPTPSPTTDPGFIDIKVHGGNKGNGGDDSGSKANGLQAVTKAAVSNFQLGRWADAARGYEQAISMGGGRASNYQRLGDCYNHLGKAGQAVDAYSRAAESYEAAGNTASAEVCRQAIKTLKGS